MNFAHFAVQNCLIQTKNLTKTGAKVMQFHSGSSNMMSLRLYVIDAFVGSSLAG